MAFTMDVTVDAIIDTVVVHEVGKKGVLRAGKKGRVVYGGDDGARVLFLCCLQGELQADSFTFINFCIFDAKIFCRRQYPASCATDGDIACHDTVILQKLKFVAVALLHFRKACPPIIVVAPQEQLASGQLCQPV